MVGESREKGVLNPADGMQMRRKASLRSRRSGWNWTRAMTGCGMIQRRYVAVHSPLCRRTTFTSWLQALLQALAYASYLNIQSAILPPPKHRSQISSYARAVNACLNAIPYMELSVRIPIYDPIMLHVSSSAGSAISAATMSSPSVLFSDEPSVATWEMWDAIRTVCEYNPRLTLSAYAYATPLACS